MYIYIYIYLLRERYGCSSLNSSMLPRDSVRPGNHTELHYNMCDPLVVGNSLFLFRNVALLVFKTSTSYCPQLIRCLHLKQDIVLFRINTTVAVKSNTLCFVQKQHIVCVQEQDACLFKQTHCPWSKHNTLLAVKQSSDCLCS